MDNTPIVQMSLRRLRVELMSAIEANKMLIDLGEDMVNLYITSQEKPYTPWTSNVLRLNGSIL